MNVRKKSDTGQLLLIIAAIAAVVGFGNWFGDTFIGPDPAMISTSQH